LMFINLFIVLLFICAYKAWVISPPWPHPTQMFFYQEIHVFLQLRCIGLFGKKWAFLPLENYDLQEVFLSKTNSK
jgi:hypothetical protein